MKFLFYLLFNTILLGDACFIFPNTTRSHCYGLSTSTFCDIDDPLAKIQQTNCDRNSKYRVQITLKTIGDLEKLFFHNAETVEKLVESLEDKPNRRLVIVVENASSTSRVDFQFDDQWLTALLNRFESHAFTILLEMTFDHVPAVYWTEANVTALVGGKNGIWIHFNTKDRRCWAGIMARKFNNYLHHCINITQTEFPLINLRTCIVLRMFECNDSTKNSYRSKEGEILFSRRRKVNNEHRTLNKNKLA